MLGSEEMELNNGPIGGLESYAASDFIPQCDSGESLSDYFRLPRLSPWSAYFGRPKDFLRPKTTEDENRQVHNLLDTVRFDRQNTQQVSFRNTRSNARLHVIPSRVQSGKTQCEAEQARG